MNQSYFHFIPEKAVPDWMPAFDRDNHRVSVVNPIWLIHFSLIRSRKLFQANQTYISALVTK